MAARGTLHLVVGPSGAGKDTLIDAARLHRPDLLIPRRIITRPADAGGEAHEGVSPEAFERSRQAGAFALHWQAHGLSYGIPVGIETVLDAGRPVLANVSRSVIDTARQRYAPLRILFVTAPPAILAQRLAARGRERPEDIERRLARAPYAVPTGPDVWTVDNGGAMDTAVADFVAALAPADQPTERS